MCNILRILIVFVVWFVPACVWAGKVLPELQVGDTLRYRTTFDFNSVYQVSEDTFPFRVWKQVEYSIIIAEQTKHKCVFEWMIERDTIDLDKSIADSIDSKIENLKSHSGIRAELSQGEFSRTKPAFGSLSRSRDIAAKKPIFDEALESIPTVQEYLSDHFIDELSRSDVHSKLTTEHRMIDTVHIGYVPGVFTWTQESGSYGYTDFRGYKCAVVYKKLDSVSLEAKMTAPSAATITGGGGAVGYLYLDSTNLFPIFHEFKSEINLQTEFGINGDFGGLINESTLNNTVRTELLEFKPASAEKPKKQGKIIVPQGDLIIQGGHTGEVTGIKFLDDGLIVSIAKDGRAILWDVSSSAKVKGLSVSTDELVDLAGSRDQEVLFFRDSMGKIWKLSIGSQGKLQCIAYCDIKSLKEQILRLLSQSYYTFTGNRLLDVKQDGSLGVWPNTTGHQEMQELGHHRLVGNRIEFFHERVYCSEISSDGRLILTSSEMGDSICVWSTKTGAQIDNIKLSDLAVMNAWPDVVKKQEHDICAFFGKDDKSIVFSSTHSNVIWEIGVQQASSGCDTLLEFDERVLHFRYFNNYNMIFVVLESRWEFWEGTPLEKVKSSRYNRFDKLRSDVSDSGKHFAVCDGQTIAVSLCDKDLDVTTFRPTTDVGLIVANFAELGKVKIENTSSYGMPISYDLSLADGSLRAVPAEEHDVPSGAGSMINTSVDEDSPVIVDSYEFRDCVGLQMEIDSPGSPDGRYYVGRGCEFLFHNSVDGELSMWNTATGESMCVASTFDSEFNVIGSFGVNKLLLFFPDEQEIPGLVSGNIASWPNSQCQVDSMFCLEMLRVNNFRNPNSFSPFGKYFAIADVGRVKLLEFHDDLKSVGKKKTTQQTYLAHLDSVSYAALVRVSPDECHLACGFKSGNVWLWNIHKSDGESIQSEETQYYNAQLPLPSQVKSEIVSISFSMDSRFILAGRADGSITIWDTKQKAEVVTVFVKNQLDYIITTPDGYYMMSRDRLDGIAYRFGNRAYPSYQFDVKYNRPDIVLARLGYASDEDIAAYKLAHDFRKTLLGIETDDIDFTGEDIPKVEIVNRQELLQTNDRSIELDIEASCAGQPLARIQVEINGVPVARPQVNDIFRREDGRYTWRDKVKVELEEGENEIQVSAFTVQEIESLREIVRTQKTGDTVQRTLYITTIGVSQYKHLPKSNYLRYAHEDARSIAGAFQKLQGRMFDTVIVNTLIDTMVTKETIQTVCAAFEQSSVNDYAIVFLSGHGLQVPGALEDSLDPWYFATYDVDPENPQERGLSYREIEDLLSDIPARRRVIMIDACYSGESIAAQLNGPASTVEREDGRQNSLSYKIRDNSEVLTPSNADDEITVVSGAEYAYVNRARILQEELFVNLRRGTGAVTISASRGGQPALEPTLLGEGVFTHYVLKCLELSEDSTIKADGVVRISELRDFVREGVAKHTGQFQTPTMRRENPVVDFPIY